MTHLTSSIDPGAVLVRRSDVLMASISGQAVLMSVQKGVYFGLDMIGTEIWRRLETPIAVSSLIELLIAAFDGEADEIRRDVVRFLDALAEAELIATT